MPDIYDAVIVGAGSAGSRVAARLAQEGLEVIVLERKSALDEPVCCTGIVGWEGIRSYGIAEKLILSKASGARLFSPSGKVLALFRPEPQAAIVDRPTLNTALAEAAMQSGAEYILDAPVREIGVRRDMVSLRAERSGKQIQVQARAAVLASGFSPNLTGRLGLGKIGDFAAGAQAVVETNATEIELYFGRDIAPGFFAWLVPTRSGSGLAGLMARRGAARYQSGFLERLAAAGKIATADVPVKYGVVPLKPLPRTYSDRILVVGNAAGQVKPTTGGGVYYGLICADIAAGVLAAALRQDNLSARTLAAYHREWKRRLGHELKVGYWARKLFERLDDRRLDRLFETLHSSGMMEALVKSEDLSFDWQSRGIMKGLGNAALAAVFGKIRWFR